jgi:hypothetical protein
MEIAVAGQKCSRHGTEDSEAELGAWIQEGAGYGRNHIRRCRGFGRQSESAAFWRTRQAPEQSTVIRRVH